jgi:eukaryotic-like serine/threonine-protein kinase
MSSLFDAWEQADREARDALLARVRAEHDDAFVNAFEAMIDETLSAAAMSANHRALAQSSETQSRRRLLHDGLPVFIREQAIARVRAIPERALENSSQLNNASPYETGDKEDLSGRLEKSINEIDAPFNGATETKAGARFGAYELVRELGRGGMARVWLAKRIDGLHARQVALKVPHSGEPNWLVTSRFARERAILAGLEHPGIARLYETGLDRQQRPYIALEYVDGKSIDRFVADSALAPQAIVGLFVKVLEAVVYAHGRLVIHRDIKPSNIMVDASGAPRLLDFGIAKLLNDDEATGTDATQLTRISGRALTLDYASPEQVNAEPLTVASDIYSLGVVLFELLTGSSPYATPQKPTTRRELEHLVIERDIAKPSDHVLAHSSLDKAARAKLARSLRGDLDTIVLKALKRAPAERYTSAQNLLDDCQRYLAFKPIQAKPDTARYVFGKFVRRNRFAVATACAIGFVVVAGSLTTLWQAERARAALAVAETANRETTQALARSEATAAVLRQVLSGAAGTTTVTEMLDSAEQVVGAKYANDAATRAALQYDLASIRLTRDDRGSLKRLLDAALASASESESEGLARAVGCALASGRAREGARQEALQMMNEAIAFLADRPQDNAARIECLTHRAALKRDLGLAPTDFADDARSALALIVPRPSNASNRAFLLSLIGTAEQTTAGFPASLSTQREALALLEAAGEGEAQIASSIRLGLSMTLGAAGQSKKAIEVLKVPFERASASGKTMTSAAIISYAGELRKVGRFEESAKLLQTAIAAAEASGSTPLVGYAKLSAARTACEMHDAVRCESLAREAGEALERVLPPEHVTRAGVFEVIGTAHLLKREYVSAIAQLGKASDALQKLAPNFQVRAVQPLTRLSEAQLAIGDTAAAHASAHAALAISERALSGFDHSEWMGRSLLARAKVERASGQGENAFADAKAAANHLAASLGERAPLTVEAAQWAVVTLRGGCTDWARAAKASR